jgi:S-adenosylmethionine:tRNA ribosyltransferase-isomerase
MPTLINKFNYNLPKNLIAQSPAVPRESARLMIINRTSKTIIHKNVSDLPDYFIKGDILIINNTKVFKARLIGHIKLNDSINSKVEILLINHIDKGVWKAIGQPGRKLLINRQIIFARDFIGTISDVKNDGSIEIDFKETKENVINKANTYGQVPIPPYIKTQPDIHDYQTSYATVTGSVAAPTAGFHLTQNIRKQLTEKGVEILEITLHVGLGTFLPIKSDYIENHIMHQEYVNVSENVAQKINEAKTENRRIIAVGTTCVRTLEGVAKNNSNKIKKFSGDINLYITPGYKFNVVDAMITNFHLPKSTLIILVSSFAGRNLILKAYKDAIKNKYRFYSFGDAMLII